MRTRVTIILMPLSISGKVSDALKQEITRFPNTNITF